MSDQVNDTAQDPLLCQCNGGRCPDYDETCTEVKDPLKCFLGLPQLAANGIVYEAGQAKGFCPFIHPSN